MFIKKIFSILTTIIIVLLIAPSPAFASSNFTTDYHVIYSIAKNGLTHADLAITLTNTTSQFRASSYKLQLGFENMTNIKVSDPGGPINPNIIKTDSGYVIDMTFNKKAVGQGNQLPFTISFDTINIARSYGKIWEINIPGISNPGEFKSFTVEVRPDQSFGRPTYIKPQQPNNSLIFTKSQLGQSGISIAFGDKQIYNFDLTYHIKNTNLYSVKKHIALPPTTNYQNVSIISIVPQPDNVTQDSDGNWLAEYSLNSTQKLDINVMGKAEVKLTPDQTPLSPSDLAAYVKEKPYWETKSPEIRKLAEDLKTPKEIYDYVISILGYDFSRVSSDKPRLGAVGVLKSQHSAACREFTDLFIAIARAAGIPAREVDGFAYTENIKQRPLSLQKDILHAWPEYYDTNKRMWVMIDPTWGSTTGGTDYFSVLDFDHLAFAIKGQDSNFPVPAGGYKVDEGNGIKDVRIAFSNNITVTAPDVEISTTFANPVTAGLPIHGKIKVRNISQTVIPEQVLSINSLDLTPHEQIVASRAIPPFGYVTYDFIFKPTSFLTNKEAGYTIRIADKTSSDRIKISPLFLILLGGGIIGLLTIIILIFAFKRRRVRVS
jgi:transglutaminase-like putative cysteine protease